MKKIRLIQWLALLLAGALLFGFAACNRTPDFPTTEPPTTTEVPTTTEPPTTDVSALPGFWSIEIRGVQGVSTFTSEDARILPKVQMEMTSTNLETGLSAKVKYGGVTLRSLLTNFCGMQGVASVTVTSISGVSAVYSAAMAMAGDTLLAWEVDGAPIDADPPLRMCPKSGTPEMLIRQVSSLNVVAGPEIQTTYATYPTPPMGYTNDYNYTTSTRTTTRTAWPTYDASVSGIDQFTTTTPPTDEEGNPITEEPTTTVTTTTAPTTTRTTTTTKKPTTPYTYVQPTSRTTRTTTTTTKPDWWPEGLPYP
ncbi:MAG: hypothetical protein FWE98_00995 [Oscillospiraceae bacterium]|nr:hypothetical protein [Oscillospiraceae bacterium]